MVGSAQLPAGEYTLKVDGSNAVFTNVESNKSVTTPVKIESADKKFAVTSVETNQEGDAQHIKDIQLGGSTTSLYFEGSSRSGGAGHRFLWPALAPCGARDGTHARAQDEPTTLDDLVQSAQEGAQENLDEDVLRALQNQDQAKVKQLFKEIQKRLQGEYVIDLAPLKSAASAILPILKRYEETPPLRPLAQDPARLPSGRRPVPSHHQAPQTRSRPASPTPSQPDAAAGKASLGAKACPAPLAGHRQDLRVAAQTGVHRPKGPPGTGVACGSGILL